MAKTEFPPRGIRVYTSASMSATQLYLQVPEDERREAMERVYTPGMAPWPEMCKGIPRSIPEILAWTETFARWYSGPILTLSEAVVLRFSRLVREGKIPADHVELHVYGGKFGTQHVVTGFDNRGRIKDEWPSPGGFHEWRLDELFPDKPDPAPTADPC
jgi:hypothetical protein